MSGTLAEAFRLIAELAAAGHRLDLADHALEGRVRRLEGLADLATMPVQMVDGVLRPVPWTDHELRAAAQALHDAADEVYCEFSSGRGISLALRSAMRNLERARLRLRDAIAGVPVSTSAPSSEEAKPDMPGAGGGA